MNMTRAWDKEKSVDSCQFLSQEEEMRGEDRGGEDRRREDRTGNYITMTCVYNQYKAHSD